MGGLEEGPGGREEMKYRRRFSEVYAVRFSATPDGIEELKALCGSSLGRVVRASPGEPAEAEIGSLEGGRMVVKYVVREGDWVVMEPPGVLRVCDHDLFCSMYEAAP